MVVQVNTDQMISKGNEVKGIKNELRMNMEQIEQLVLGLSGEWQGEAERSFEQKILFVRKQFDSILSFFGEYADLLILFADSYDNLENEISAKIRLA